MTANPADVGQWIPYIALAIAAASAAVSLWAAATSRRHSDYQLRLANRAHLHNLLLEVDREILRDPSLWHAFKSNPMPARASPCSPEDAAKHEMYAVMYLNVFEFAHIQLKELRKISPAEKETREAFEQFLVDFFADCIVARDVWNKYKHTYYRSFRRDVDELVARADQESGTA
jgi:hypothetical protein